MDLLHHPLAFAMLASYFIGALPTAVIIAKRVGNIDILEQGSGNPGASNIYRLFGPQWASATLMVDLFKGYLPVVLSQQFASSMIHPIYAQNEIAVMVWVGFAAFLGHVFSPFLRFKGGKGAATGMGATFAIAPQATTLAILVYGVALFIWKKFAAGTLAAALSFPIFLYFREGGQEPESLIWGLLVPILLVTTHRQNIARIMHGDELPMNSAKGENKEG
ncbi:glycerol-3-phosphate acyltransferase [bacterium BMS3Bbin04]|nr:glycerol-3-phosphate acyltransferase [bacterium BMS3Bbin04]